MDIFEGLRTTDCLICLEPLVEVPATGDAVQESVVSRREEAHGVRPSVSSSSASLASSRPRRHGARARGDSEEAERSPPSPLLGTSEETPFSDSAVYLPSSSTSPLSQEDGTSRPPPPRHEHERQPIVVFLCGENGTEEEEDDLNDASSLGGHHSSTHIPSRQRPTTALSRVLSNVVVLPCGHLFHHFCFLQLIEYGNSISGCQCPVCRLPVPDPSVDAVRLQFRPRPHGAVPAASGASVPSTALPVGVAESEPPCDTAAKGPSRRRERKVTMTGDEPHASKVEREGKAVKRTREASCEAEEDEEEEERKKGSLSPSEVRQKDRSTEAFTPPPSFSVVSPVPLEERQEVELVKEVYIPPAQAYCALLDRLSTSAEERLERLRSRSAPLSARREQLKEEVEELRYSAETAKRRVELIKGTATTEKWGELVKVTQELKYMVDCCTAELAVASREGQSLDRQIGKYKAKLEALRRKNGHKSVVA